MTIDLYHLCSSFQFQYGTIGTRQLVSLVEYEQISIPVRFDWNKEHYASAYWKANFNSS